MWHQSSKVQWEDNGSVPEWCGWLHGGGGARELFSSFGREVIGGV